MANGNGKKVDYYRWLLPLVMTAVVGMVGIGVFPRCDEVQLKAAAEKQHLILETGIIKVDKKIDVVEEKAAIRDKEISTDLKDAQNKIDEKLDRIIWEIRRRR